ncbi:MAG: hypothetical protein KGJ75_09815, partial [Alphaproteobacteria bacterium]|nr:hypothetical protein [Alphaproteobacteria bacterium]
NVLLDQMWAAGMAIRKPEPGLVISFGSAWRTANIRPGRAKGAIRGCAPRRVSCHYYNACRGPWLARGLL